MSDFPSDLQIANAATLKPIQKIAGKLGISPDALVPYGHDKAKINYEFLDQTDKGRDGKLVLVTAISPTPAGEGKTTTTVGIGDALCQLGENALICLREPSLGPCFGMKGGAAGGGYAQVVPMADINLHFTGDLHAIGAANNLLAAMIDNHVHWGNALDIDVRQLTWRRAVDLNDRSLRHMVTGLGGPIHGTPTETGFDITVASEVMAVFCLATDLADLKTRLGSIVIGRNRAGEVVRCRDIGAEGAMSALLRDALQPNLVQTLENNPALMHGGPFANIAHGCNSVMATKTALRLADIVITEAGFGADLGAQKFFDIKCRLAGLRPDASVLVATIRALKMHGGVARGDLDADDPEAVRRGCVNLGRHYHNLLAYNVPVIVAINHFAGDSEAEVEVVLDYCRELGVECGVSKHFVDGGAGALDVARLLRDTLDNKTADFRPLYPDHLSLWEKARCVARRVYGADDISSDSKVRAAFERLEREGFGHFPVCMAKTPYSFSADPTLLGAPSGHVVQVREVRLAAGAEFVVVMCGAIMTMPGLPRTPAALDIDVDVHGEIRGLF